MPLNNTLLPLNAKPIEKAVDMLNAQRLDFDLTPVDINPLTCPSQLLPYLAAMWRVVIDQLSEQEQRNLISNALEIHRYKGTVYAVQKGLASLLLDSEITPWFKTEPVGEAHTFNVDIFVYDKAVTVALINAIRNKIDSGKALSTRYSLTMNLGVNGTRFYGGAMQITAQISGIPFEYDLDDISNVNYRGGTLQLIATIEGQPTYAN